DARSGHGQCEEIYRQGCRRGRSCRDCDRPRFLAVRADSGFLSIIAAGTPDQRLERSAPSDEKSPSGRVIGTGTLLNPLRIRIGGWEKWQSWQANSALCPPPT